MPRAHKVLSLALLVQAAVFYGAWRNENVPNTHPLQLFTRELPGWFTAQEGYVDAETQAVLQADDTLSRAYGSLKYPQRANLFVAYFKTQRTGKAPHSPKNCLPGSGWEPSRDDLLTVAIPGAAAVQVNRYVIAKGDQKSVVLYWYQSPNRVIASEYRAKFWTVADAIRYNRTDTALVRVIVPVNGLDEDAAEKIAVDFVQSMFAPLQHYLPA
jgi:EpsI family protein